MFRNGVPWKTQYRQPVACHAIIRTHCSDVIMSKMVYQITSLTIVYSTFYSGADQRKHQTSASLALVRGIHRWPMNSPHKWPVTRKMSRFDNVITLRWRHNGRDSVSNHQPHDCLLNHLFRRRSKKKSKVRVTGPCAVNSPVTGEFPAQMATNTENVSFDNVLINMSLTNVWSCLYQIGSAWSVDRRSFWLISSESLPLS